MGGEKKTTKHQHNGHTRPSRKEPLEAPRSTRNAPKVLSTTRRACDRLTEGWAITTSLSVSLPARNHSRKLTDHDLSVDHLLYCRSCIRRCDTVCKSRIERRSHPGQAGMHARARPAVRHNRPHPGTTCSTDRSCRSCTFLNQGSICPPNKSTVDHEEMGIRLTCPTCKAF